LQELTNDRQVLLLILGKVVAFFPRRLDR